jgi:hypothetical protein
MLIARSVLPDAVGPIKKITGLSVIEFMWQFRLNF